MTLDVERSPSHHTLRRWVVAPYSFIVVLPLLYALGVTLLWDARWFGGFVIGASIIVGALSVGWFIEWGGLAYLLLFVVLTGWAFPVFGPL